jgi:hypothetical protein
MANSQQRPPLARLILALRQEKIRFLIVGMSAAVIQGAPVVTFDTEIWLDLPPRQYMRAARLCLKLGATMRANTVFIFPGDLIVNFLYTVTGLGTFALEFRGARHLNWLGLRRVPTLPVARIYRSKNVIRRPKDLAHMAVLKQLMACERRMAAGKPSPKRSNWAVYMPECLCN